MKNMDIPVGISDFAEIRNSGYYYIDKTGLIEEILKTKATKVTLITRPRRFGKTLGMSMLENFFNICKDSAKLFEGLYIAKQKALCDVWMNQWPVIFLSLKSVDGNDFSTAYCQLAYEIGELYKAHDYLMQSSALSDEEKKLFLNIKERKTGKIEVMRSLQLLSKLLSRHYNKEVILLIDEYDVPMAKATNNGYYKEMLEIMKGLLQSLKDNQALRFAIITGCLRIAKESIFTGTNNFVSDTITVTRLNEYFGFVQSEVDQILQDADIEEKADLIKKWYDGYHFGDFDVYCPWDVMCYLVDLQKNPNQAPASYWENTSDNSIIRSFIDYAGSSITKKLEILLDGGYIVQKIDESLTYDYLHSSEDNLWSILYLTGYLTLARTSETGVTYTDDLVALKIPNEEFKKIFEKTVGKWFKDNATKWNKKVLFDAVWNGDSEGITKEMNSLLRRTISYHDYREDFYHAFLSGIFAGAGYQVQSNREHGEGRSDVVVCDSVNGRVAIFEVKRTRVLQSLDKECDNALRQINERMYAEDFEGEYDTILCYGISFFKKRCLVKKNK